MAPQRPPYLNKRLTATDITARLSWPSRLLPNLPGQQPGRRYRAHFSARDGGGRVWRLCCTTRQRGYYKPVVTGDWLQFVKSKNLREGDRVLFYDQQYSLDDRTTAHFVVAVRRARSIKLLGHNVQGYTDEE